MNLNKLQAEMYANHYVRGNDDLRWYASGPGLLEPVAPFKSVIDGSDCVGMVDTLVYEDRIDVTRSFHPEQVIASFATVAEYFEYCALFGQISEGGLPAFSNSWD